MEKVPKLFDMIDDDQYKPLVRMAEAVVPETKNLRVGPNGSLRELSSFHWSHFDEDGEALFVVLQASSVSHDTTVNFLEVTEAFMTSHTNELQMTKYRLNTDTGKFLVIREFRKDEDQQKDFVDDDTTHEQKSSQDKLEYELGLMAPEAGDWDKFVQIIERGMQMKEQEAL